ncbi:MAG: hypothetical protein HYY07_00795, partial [Elusimicrobia bacterium]|nr:hypothetical protein [Elusimicrobiota bacterium]
SEMSRRRQKQVEYNQRH